MSREWLDVYGGVVRDATLRPGLKSYLLRIDEQSLARETQPMYRERYAARIRLLREAAGALAGDLLAAYHAVDTYRRGSEPKDGIDERRLKAVLLRILIETGTAETQQLAEQHFRQAWSITDRTSALMCINVSEHPERRAIMEEAYTLWKDHLAAYTSYLQVVGSGIHDDVFEMIEREARRPGFRMEHPSHNRALLLPLSMNNKMLWTDRGIAWLTETAIRLTPINENTVLHLIACFQHVRDLAPDLKPKVIAALDAIRKQVNAAAAPSVAGRLDAYLSSADEG